MGTGSSLPNETPGLFLLLRSLSNLHHHYACLQSSIHAFLLLLQADSHEGTELWSVAIREVVTNIDCSLNAAREDLLNNCDAKLLRRLAACILKTMDIVCNMTLLHSMPTCMLWKIFYVLISRYTCICNCIHIASLLPPGPLPRSSMLCAKNIESLGTCLGRRPTYCSTFMYICCSYATIHYRCAVSSIDVYARHSMQS